MSLYKRKHTDIYAIKYDELAKGDYIGVVLKCFMNKLIAHLCNSWTC